MNDTALYILKQLEILRHFIHKNVNADYVYIDVPLYWNVGDWLIAMGAWELLNEISYKCLGRLRWEDYEYTTIAPNTIIILQGGGNFGDLWRGATEARNEVIKQYPNNKIIILSQTITYTDKKLLRHDAKLCAEHKDLHICARDKESYEVAQKYFGTNYVYMLPDTAIGLYPSLPKYKGAKTKCTLIMNRRDKEADVLFHEDGDVKDWEEILRDIHFNIVYGPYKIIRKVRKIAHMSAMHKWENCYALRVLYPYVRKKIPWYFMQYDYVKTTRLHGYLLASMMHIPVEVKDNKNNKTTHYINTWMR